MVLTAVVAVACVVIPGISVLADPWIYVIVLIGLLAIGPPISCVLWFAIRCPPRGSVEATLNARGTDEEETTTAHKP
jgi:hypothetical protein